MWTICKQDILAYQRRSQHHLSPGLYLGYLKLSSSVDQIKVLVPQRTPSMLCHSRIRDNWNVSRSAPYIIYASHWNLYIYFFPRNVMYWIESWLHWSLLGLHLIIVHAAWSETLISRSLTNLETTSTARRLLAAPLLQCERFRNMIFSVCKCSPRLQIFQICLIFTTMNHIVWTPLWTVARTELRNQHWVSKKKSDSSDEMHSRSLNLFIIHLLV